MKKGGQAATELIILLSVFLAILGILFFISQGNVDAFNSKFRLDRLNTALNDIEGGVESVHQQGFGARTRIFVSFPSGLINYTISGNKISIKYNNQGNTAERIFDFNVSGDLDINEGSRYIYIISDNGFVNISASPIEFNDSSGGGGPSCTSNSDCSKGKVCNGGQCVSASSCLTINRNGACFTTTDLINVTLTNTCGNNLTVIGNRHTWNSSQQVRFNEISGQNRWHFSCGWGCTPTGTQNSGVFLKYGTRFFNITSGQTRSVNQVEFSGNMETTGAKNISLTYTMLDGSNKSSGYFIAGSCSAPAGNQASCTNIITSSACIGAGGDKQLQGVTIQNNCTSQSITATATRLTWTSSRVVQTFRYNGQDKWDDNCNWGCSPSGSQSSGVLLDFGTRDETTSAGVTKSVDRVIFNNDMSGNAFTLTLNLSDGSTRTTPSFSPPDC